MIFIGATTENPSFELNSALLSRARVYLLRSLDERVLAELIAKALAEPRGLGRKNIQIAPELIARMARAADGDGRRALNLLEIAADLARVEAEVLVVDAEVMEEVLQASGRRYDKQGDLFYENIDAALAQLVRALGGAQRVGHALRPDKSPEDAGKWLQNCLDDGKRDTLHPAQLMLILRMGKKAGVHRVRRYR